MMQRIEVPPEAAGTRLDSFLSTVLAPMSRSAAQKLIAAEGVVCADRPLKKQHVLQGGEVLCVTVPEVRDSALVAQDIALDIVYEDGDVIVLNKPRGMVVHPAAGNPDGTLVNALLHHCGDSLSGIGGERRPGIVHRIDKDTSGLLIVAKHDAAHLHLSEQLRARTLSRVYEAVVVGNPKQHSGTIEAPIGRSTKDRKKMAVVADGRAARTDYECLGYYNGFAHVRCKLHSGRTHQIRVHMAHIGHPVAGDALYGAKQDKTGLGGQCLHAVQLRFVHPRTGETVEIACPLPGYFNDFLHKIGRENNG